MPRPLRIHVPGGFYHVTLRGNHQQALFRADSDRLLLNAIVRAALEKHVARIHAYCWMTNHLHFLLQVGDEPLSATMRDIGSGYARAFQKKLATTGHLFERRYYSILVDADRYLLALLRYIHLNPISAGIVSHPGEYRWSSHHAYAGSNVDPWVTVDFGLRMLGDTPIRARARYRELLSQEPDAAQAPLAAAKDAGGQCLGDADFIRRATAGTVPNQQRESLHSIIQSVCADLGIEASNLRTHARHHSVGRARALIVTRALKCGVSLSSIARELGCDRKTLREALRRFDSESR